MEKKNEYLEILKKQFEDLKKKYVFHPIVHKSGLLDLKMEYERKGFSDSFLPCWINDLSDAFKLLDELEKQRGFGTDIGFIRDAVAREQERVIGLIREEIDNSRKSI